MFSKVGKTTKMALNTDDKHINKDKIYIQTTCF